MKKDVIFSIFMCAKNAESTILRAIDSVETQTFQKWEMIIIDNGSEDGTWSLIQEAMERNSHICGIHLDCSVGWPKGASLCMEHAAGKYMMFLAADDFFLNPGCLQAVKNILYENPDIVFCGHALVQLKGNMYDITGGIIPEKNLYIGEDKISDLFEIMNTLYYNSFFHFISLDLLRNNGINFYEPFYADYEAVTEAICRASKIAVVNYALYALTVNTSQTVGVSTWKAYVMQWRSVKNILIEKGHYNKEKLHYIAIRIFNNNMSILKAICFGETVRDKEMNDFTVSYAEKCSYLENFLEQKETVEMLFFAGRSYYTENLFEYIKYVYAQYLRLESANTNSLEVKWIDRLVNGLCIFDGEKFINRKTIDSKNFEDIYTALSDEHNVGMFGYELLGPITEPVPEEVSDLWNAIYKTYIDWIYHRIYEMLFIAVEIKRRGRITEVIDIIKDCITMFQEIGSYLSDQERTDITNDFKMVLYGLSGS